MRNNKNNEFKSLAEFISLPDNTQVTESFGSNWHFLDELFKQGNKVVGSGLYLNNDTGEWERIEIDQEVKEDFHFYQIF